MKPTLYLMVGYPGAGKTTTAQFVSELTGAQHIWVDKERIARYGVPTFSSRESRELYELLNARALELLKAGVSVIFDTDFRFRKDREKLRELASSVGAVTVVIWLTTDKPTAKQRATVDADGEPTRLLGNMAEADFARTTSHCEWPLEGEHPIQIAGHTITKDIVAAALRT